MLRNRYEDKSVNVSNGTISRILGILAPEKGKVIFGIICSVFGSIFLLAVPLVLKQIGEMLLNYKTTPVNPDTVLMWTIIGLGLAVLSGVLHYTQTFIVSGVVARGAQKLRDQMTLKINHLPLNYFDTRNIGDVLSYVTNDVDIVGTTLNQTFSTLISSTVTVVGVIIIMFILDWKIGIVTVIVLPILLIILLKVGSKSQKFFIERSECTAEVSAHAEESFTGFNIIRVFNATKDDRARFSETNFKLEKTMAKADYYSGVSIPLMTFLSNVLFVVIALVGGIIVSRISGYGDVQTAGITPELAAKIAIIVAAINYADQLIAPITQIATNVATLQRTIASGKRIFDFLDQEDEPDESDKTVTIPHIEGNIQFDHVKFGYTKDRIIVHDFTQVGKAGQKIAIVGPTGAGKTTMVNLLMRFYEVNSGAIKIEGYDTKTMNRSYVRGLFGMVLQDTWLFEGTIMENLKYSRPDATDEEVYEACRATHCDTFIRQQPNGYNQLLGEDCGLAAGQKQLLTIARAMIQNAPMLILDEATSNVDTRTELQIQDAMDKLMKGRTSFVIAHRLSTIKNSDLIIVMKDGDVIETGNHDELMEQDGFYAALYNSQFTGKGPQFS